MLSTVSANGLKESSSPHPVSLQPPIPHCMELNTLKDLYIHELKDLYSAEKQIDQGSPENGESGDQFRTRQPVSKNIWKKPRFTPSGLNRSSRATDETTRGPKCKGMEGVVAEGAEMIEEEADEEVRDAGLIAAAQRVEALRKWQATARPAPMPNSSVTRPARSFYNKLSTRKRRPTRSSPPRSQEDQPSRKEVAMTKKDQLIAWLGDAHAMEVGIVSTLEKHIADAKGQPKVKAALNAHLRETKSTRPR